MTAQTLRIRLGVWLVILLAIPIGLYALAFQFAGIGASSFQARFATMPIAAAAHLIGGGTALLIGGFQFIASFRARHPARHRWLGRTYLLLVLFGGIGGGWLALSADGGLVARVGFFLLAILWLWSGTEAYRAIRAGDLDSHRRWMMRNYALTFGAVTLRIQLGTISDILGFGFEAAYPVVAWLAWVPNLIVVEWLLLPRLARAAPKSA